MTQNLGRTQIWSS